MTARRHLQNLAAINQAEAKQDARSNSTTGVSMLTDTKSWDSSALREEADLRGHPSFQPELVVAATQEPLWDFTTPASLSWEELSLPILEA